MNLRWIVLSLRDFRQLYYHVASTAVSLASSDPALPGGHFQLWTIRVSAIRTHIGTTKASVHQIHPPSLFLYKVRSTLTDFSSDQYFETIIWNKNLHVRYKSLSQKYCKTFIEDILKKKC